MPPLPVISPEKAAQVFESLGWRRNRQRGSHVILERPGHTSLSIPWKKELKKGTLRGIIHDAGLTVEEFLRLLGEL